MAEIWNRYDRSAARTHGARARVQGPVVDMHGHMVVEAAAEFARPHLLPDPRMQFYTEETRELTRRQDEERCRHLTGLDQRLRDLDAMGIDVQLVSPAPPQCGYSVSPEIAVAAARLVNDGVAAFVARKPDRLVALGTVPLQAGGQAAAEELERCVKQLRFKGVQILTHVEEKEISDASFAAFWARAEELGAVVTIHPAGFTEARRFGRYYFNNVIGNPLDTTMALHYLIFDGVLERHPQLKLVAVHGGGICRLIRGGWITRGARGATATVRCPARRARI